MTREARSGSEKSSEERSDSRDGETRPQGESPEASEESEARPEGAPRKANGDGRSREQSDDPREGEARPEGAPRKANGDGRSREESKNGEGDIPLDIAGHEERTNGDGVPDVDAAPDPPEEADDEEVQPVELLVQLAEEGEIEPWDIDIVAVTDKFLEALDEADLRTSGRALFYASVLLRMKSDAMLNEDDPEDEEPEVEPWELEPGQAPADAAMDGEAGPDPVASLEDEMDRRLERKRARGSPQTLDELVRELRDRERDSWWKESREYDTSDSPHGYSRGEQTLDYRSGDDVRMDDEPTEGDVTGTTHAEDIEAAIEDVEATLREQYDAGREEVLFAEVDDAGGSRVQTFLALLFLAHRGQVRLQQDDFFGDLWVQDPNAATGPEGAIAD